MVIETEKDIEQLKISASSLENLISSRSERASQIDAEIENIAEKNNSIQLSISDIDASIKLLKDKTHRVN